VIIPEHFPFKDLAVPLSRSFPRLGKEQIKKLGDALRCVDAERHLYVRTHHAMVKTEDSRGYPGGCVSLNVEEWAHVLIASEIGAHA
jgi:hypothetical protein